MAGHVLAYVAAMFLLLIGPELAPWLVPRSDGWFRGRGFDAFQFSLVVGTALWFVLFIRRHFFRAIARRGMVCWECGSDLPENVHAGTCAWCGVAYNADDLAKRWDRPKGIFNRQYRDFSMEGKRAVWFSAAVAGCLVISMLCFAVLRNRLASKSVPGTTISTGSVQAQFRWVFIVSGVMFCSWIALLVLWIRFVFISRRIRERARAMGGRMCSGCGHDLTGIGDSGLCGECGRPFEIEHLRRTWGVKTKEAGAMASDHPEVPSRGISS